MYEKTIAADHKIYSVVLSTSATKIIDLLQPDDLEDYLSYIDDKKDIAPPRPHSYSRSNRRVVVDGYIVCPSASMFVGTSATGAFEPVQSNVQFTCPVFFWLDKTYVKGSATAYIRIFFS